MIGVTEWQQGGLPHCHMAVRLRLDSHKTPMQTVHDQLKLMDDLICATIPAVGSPHYDLVRTFMMHGDPCKHCVVKRRDGTTGCRFFYPKNPSLTTGVCKKGYPIYRRGVDDTRVVPHIPILLTTLQCHVNAEYTLFSGCIAYLYKYFTKGAASSAMRLENSNEHVLGGADEIAAFRKARVLCAAEVVYRTFGYNVNFREPSVIVCRIHLPRRTDGGVPRQSNMSGAEENFDLLDPAFEAHKDEDSDDDGLDADDTETNGDYADGPPPLNNDSVFSTNRITGENETFLDLYFARPDVPFIMQMTFTEFFAKMSIKKTSSTPRTRKTNQARRLSAIEEYVDVCGRTWVPRQKRILARIPFVSTRNRELYALRLLLLNIPASSWGDLRGSETTFRDRAIAEGFIDTAKENIYTMLDAVRSSFSSTECRHLLCVIMCNNTDVYGVWSCPEIRNHLAFDFLPSSVHGHGEGWPEDVTMDLCLMALVNHLSVMGIAEVSLDVYGLPNAPTTDDRLTEILQLLPSPEYPEFKKYAAFIGFSIDTLKKSKDFLKEVRDALEHHLPTPEQVTQTQCTLNSEQATAFNLVKVYIDAKRPLLFHVNASAGCGKTYWANFVYDYARTLDNIAICVATTGIAALHFKNGRTGHSMFSIPIEMIQDLIEGIRLQSSLLEKVNEGKNSNRIQLLRACLLFFWDEISMLNKHVLLAVDALLQAIMGNDLPFGGKIFITLGDWKQLSPVDADAESRVLDPELLTSSNSSFHLSVLSLPLWARFMSFEFHINERQKHDPEFHTVLTKIGLDHTCRAFPVEGLPPNILRTESIDHALQWLFFDHPSHPFDPRATHNRSFIAPYNNDVDIVNNLCEQHMLSANSDLKIRSLRSADSFEMPSGETTQSQKRTTNRNIPDSVDDVNASLHDIELQYARENDEIHGVEMPFDASEMTFDYATGLSNEKIDHETFSVEHLNSIKMSGVPNHVLRIGIGMIVMLLRNLDPVRRLLNGKRFVVVDIHANGRLIMVTPAEMYGHAGAPIYLLPRIQFKGRLSRAQDAMLLRKQFPVRPAYAITIHKSQSSTLDRVVIDLRQGIFDHGQLYVALSRVRQGSDLMILLRPDQTEIRNIVIRMLLGIYEQD